MTIEDLAVMVKHGFDETATKTELLALKKDLHQLAQKTDDGFFAVNRRLDLLREDISDLPDIRGAVQDLDERLVRVERKVGVGK